MKTTPVCPRCGAPLPSDAPQGLCPQCLLNSQPATEFDSKAGSGNPSGPGKPPELSEIAAAFPHLEILECIGQGGMGIVYKARQPRLDRIVALKILQAETARDPSFTERFTREARALAKISHPGIVTIYDFGNVGSLYYLIMEFVEGASLGQMIRSHQIKPAEALGLVMQICEALQFAHDRGVVHRDIKPGNILVDKSGRVKIADFGLAKMLDAGTANVMLTGEHHVMGTPHYMAPEQMKNPLEVDHRADIYSLGVVFYEMLTGDLPLGRFAPPSARMGGVRVDVRLDEVVLRTLEQEPARRYQHAKEVKTSVQEIADGFPGPGQASGGKPEVTEPKRRSLSQRSALARKGALLAIGLAVIAGLIAIAMQWAKQGQAVVRENPSNLGHFTYDGRLFNYKVQSPVGHRINFWIEWTQNGKRVDLPDFKLSESFTPARGRGFKGYADLVIWNHQAPPQQGTNAIKWQWGLRGTDALSSSAAFAKDPFQGLSITDSSFGHQPVHHARPGQEITLAVVRGDKEQLEGQPWDETKAGLADLEMRLKFRLDRVPEKELREGPQSSSATPPQHTGKQ